MTIQVSPTINEALQRGVPELSIIVPAYNEEENVEASVNRITASLAGFTDNYELLMVDDGSTDGTYSRLCDVSSDRVKVIRSMRNLGKGGAVKLAASEVKGANVLVMDSDLDIDASAIRRQIEALSTTDICIASKRHPNSVYHAPLTRKFLSLAFNRIVRLLIGLSYVDTQTGLKAARADAFKRIMAILSVKRFAYDVEFLTVASLMKLRISEQPVTILQTSKFKPKAVVFMLLDLLGIAYRFRIRHWYQRCLTSGGASYKPLLRI